MNAIQFTHFGSGTILRSYVYPFCWQFKIHWKLSRSHWKHFMQNFLMKGYFKNLIFVEKKKNIILVNLIHGHVALFFFFFKKIIYFLHKLESLDGYAWQSGGKISFYKKCMWRQCWTWRIGRMCINDVFKVSGFWHARLKFYYIKWVVDYFQGR